MRKQALIIIALVVVTLLFKSCKPKDFRRDSFSVKKVISGNQIELRNGYKVTLIGINTNISAKPFLQKLVKSKKVKFVFDSKSPLKRLSSSTKDKSFFAYVIVGKDRECLNSKLLSSGVATIDYHPYLNDSLNTYRNLLADNHRPIVPPPAPEPNSENENKPIDPYYNDDDDDFNEENLFGKGINGELQKLIQACDYFNPITRDFAVKEAGKASGEYNISQVIYIYDAIRQPNWKYVNDPKNMEYYSKASNTISRTNLSGDCDDYAILMYSLIEAIGGEARITFAWNPEMGHAFTEVNIQGFNLRDVEKVIRRKFSDYSVGPLYYRKDSGGIWLNLDWWAAYPGGEYMNYDQQIIFYPAEEKYTDKLIYRY